MTPIYKIEIDGSDITAKIKPYFVSLAIEDKEGDQADSVELVLADNNTLALPSKGGYITVWIGYKGQRAVKYGPYIVDYARQSGPPDQITLKAHGADLRDTMKVKKSRHFDNTSLGDLVAIIAAEHDLMPSVHEDYIDIVIPYIAQDNINNLALLKKLARQYGARVKPVNGRLDFTPKGILRTSSKKSISKTDCTRYAVHLPDRFRYGSVEARWHDVDQAKFLSVKVGDLDPVQVLSDTYASEPEAYHAAKAEMRLIKKIQGKFFITLPMHPTLRNETPITLSGFKQQINNTPWVAIKVKHTINSAGATSIVEGEIQPL